MWADIWLRLFDSAELFKPELRSVILHLFVSSFSHENISDINIIRKSSQPSKQENSGCINVGQLFLQFMLNVNTILSSVDNQKISHIFLWNILISSKNSFHWRQHLILTARMSLSQCEMLPGWLSDSVPRMFIIN